MKKIISIGSIAGTILFILAAMVIYFSARNMISIRSADNYKDQGVHTFTPYQVLPVQVPNTSAGERERRTSPAKTVYMVYYRSADASGYQWSEQTTSVKAGQDTVSAGKPVERRVLSIPKEHSYITVESDQTAKSYTSSLRRQYVISMILSAAYMLLYLAVCGIKIHIKSRKEG